MDIQQQLDSIQSKNEKTLNLTPAEQNANKVDEYYQEVLRAKTVNDNAPTQLKDAETAYYKARFGDKYMDVQRQKYTAESKEVLESMMNSHQQELTKTDDKIKAYASSAIYLTNLEEVKKMWLDKIKILVQQINASKASLNNRNTFYADQEHSTLSIWILFENCFIISFILITIVTTIMGYRGEDLKMKIIGIVGLLCILFFTNKAVSLWRYLPKSVTYYTQWGYDPMESKVPWILVIVFLLFGTLCIVYINSIKAFLENMTDRWHGRPPRHIDARYQPRPYSPASSYPRYPRSDPRYPRSDPRYPRSDPRYPGPWRPTREELSRARDILRRAR